ncbi:hypothetical protein [Pedobacter sandarakinus]|uniref:hypothetical protein n=1 Tax=Pedobacter sandarakinus TaxID=353156 RepID=UPI0022480877|nr:hypothetical protein [Pedobacter sandarakinus]MCX2574417.1 hypothetical protein [Pedobacter sandarakinus]
MRNLVLFLFFGLTFAACKSEKNSDSDAIASKNVDQILAKSFSSLAQPDTFKIELTGSKPGEMIIHFSIKNANGKEIYHTKLKGTDLLDSTDPNVDLTKEKDQVVFLKTIADDFFADDNFLEPAVMPEDKADKNVPDKAFYEELKKTKLNGFKYRLGKESNVYIAWSEKEQQVKIYYRCC